MQANQGVHIWSRCGKGMGRSSYLSKMLKPETPRGTVRRGVHGCPSCASSIRSAGWHQVQKRES